MTIGVEIAHAQKVRSLRQVEFARIRQERFGSAVADGGSVWPQRTDIAAMDGDHSARSGRVSADQIRHAVFVKVGCRQGQGLAHRLGALTCSKSMAVAKIDVRRATVRRVDHHWPR